MSIPSAHFSITNLIQSLTAMSRSTVTNLCCFTQYVSNSFDNKEQVDVIFTDFSKAFDRLLMKIHNYGLSRHLVKLVQLYLSPRFQCVKYHGFESGKFPVYSGVPQGSVLGPFFFVIFIDDIIKNLNSEVLIYADDLKIFKRVSNISDCAELQKDIDSFRTWSTSNYLPVNFDKCRTMSMTNKNHRIMYDYTINSSPLSRIESFCDLGITFDYKLTFADHIGNLASEAYKCLGFIIRSSGCFKNIDTLKALYFAFVRSKLEYASIVWAPSAQTHTLAFEKIKRRFLKFLAFKVDGSSL